MNEVLILSKRFEEIWQQIQREIMDQQNTTIVFLLGSKNSGKTTFYEYLKKTDQFNILEEKKNAFQSNTSLQLNILKTPLPNPHLFLDFDCSFMEEKHINNLIFEELFLRLIEKYRIQIFYILEHPEEELLHRGFQLQEFIQKYLGKNKNNVECLNLILNKYQKNLDNKNLISKVQIQVKDLYETFSREIVVFRKITTIKQQQEEFTYEKKDEILKSLFESTPIKLQKDQFTLNYKIVCQLRQIIEKTNNSILLKIQDKIKKVNLLNQEEIKNLKIQFQKVQDDSLQENPLNFYLNSKEWNKFIQNEDKDNYNCLRIILQKFKQVILKSKILEEMNKKIYTDCQVLMQNVETYIKEDQHQNNTKQIRFNNEKKFDSLEEQCKYDNDIYKIQLIELQSILNKEYEKEPCEKTEKLKILIDTLLDYDFNREASSSKLQEYIKKKYEEEIEKEKNRCQIS